MQTPPARTETAAEAVLGNLAAELTRRGYYADVRAPHGRLTYLEVRNPRASVLAEKVYAEGDAFWWPWAEKIAPCDDVTGAAGILTRVLRAIDE